jgi:hypothetical protein
MRFHGAIMHKLKRGLMLAAVLSAALVAGCGGGGGGGGGGGVAATPAPDIGQSTTALVAFMNAQIAATDEISDPVDINALTLAVDDSAEPVPL